MKKNHIMHGGLIINKCEEIKNKMMEKQELTGWLNRLIGGELVASLQYEFASHVVIGTDYDACNAEFKAHADEEREHMNTLISCAIERDIEVNTDLKSIIDNAYPMYENMSVIDSDSLIRFHFDAEESAIAAYREFYNLIKDNDITLADEVKHILHDEIEHRKDLKKIHSSISESADMPSRHDNIYSNFSKLTKKLNDIMQ